MTEHDLKRALFKTYAMYLPGAEVIKYNDRSTLGIPDHSISWAGHTSFVELKSLDFAEDIRDSFEPQQLPTCQRLERATGGRCWVVAFRKGNKRWNVTTEIWRPKLILARPAELPRPDPGYLDNDRPTKWDTLWNTGMARFEHHSYMEIVELIVHTHS